MVKFIKKNPKKNVETSDDIQMAAKFKFTIFIILLLATSKYYNYAKNIKLINKISVEIIKKNKKKISGNIE